MNYYLIGDLHGSFKPVRDFYQRMPLLHKEENKNNILICLGDFCANFSFDYRDKNFKEKMGRYPFTYFVIRGNHEERPSICAKRNPEDWTTEDFFDGKVLVEKAYPYIKYAMDYPSVYTIGGYSTLVIPGAYSVDKYYRLQNNWAWFQNEQLTEDEKNIGRELVESNKNFDLILSHTCPICYEPTDLFLDFIDQNMVDKSMERYLGEIEYKVNYRAWCWGHYHSYREYPRDKVKPSYEDSRQLMLGNDKVVTLEDVLENPKYLESF